MVSEEARALESHLTPIGSTRPDASHEGLRAVLSHAEDADIVGLGEGTHGTREFVDLKHRLVRALVTRCGFRTVALETGFAATLALDDFVQHGTGTPADALDDIGLWVWKTEGIRSLLEWLRAFNDGRPPDDRVRLHGISLSGPEAPAARLRDYLADAPVPDSDGFGRVGERLADTSHEGENLLDVLSALADTGTPEDSDEREAALDDWIAVAEAIRGRLEDDREAYIEEWTDREWTIAHHLCRHLEQTCAWNRLRLSTPGRFDPDAFERRDRYMAENASWCLDTDGGSGVVLWAHNAHVQRGSFDMDYEWAGGTTMGEFLDRAHGDGYRPYASTFFRGKYMAVPDVEDVAQARVFTADDPPEDAVANAVSEAAVSEDSAVSSESDWRGRSDAALFFDVQRASADGRLHDWFDDERCVRSVPALVDPDADAERRYARMGVAESVDGLFIVRESSPSRLIDTTA